LHVVRFGKRKITPCEHRFRPLLGSPFFSL
jgi:hypothetical protein